MNHTDPSGKPLLLTDPGLPDDVPEKRYELAKERYNAYYKALQLTLSPAVLSVIDELLAAHKEMEHAVVEYCTAEKRKDRG